MGKGSIRFDNEINVEVEVDPSQEEGARLLSAVNLVDGQELGGGGGGDFSTAIVRISNAAGHAINSAIPYIDNHYNDIEAARDIPFDADVEYAIPLYKGRAALYFELNTESIALTGDLTDDGGGFIIVEGNGTITIS